MRGAAARTPEDVDHPPILGPVGAFCCSSAHDGRNAGLSVFLRFAEEDPAASLADLGEDRVARRDPCLGDQEDVPVLSFEKRPAGAEGRAVDGSNASISAGV